MYSVDVQSFIVAELIAVLLALAGLITAGALSIRHIIRAAGSLADTQAQQIASLSERLRAHQDEISRLAEELRLAETRIEELQDQQQRNIRTIEALGKERDALRQEVVVLRRELDRRDERIRTLEQRVSLLEGAK